MLDLRNSKCYKIGEKNPITRDNDFEMAMGNMNGVMCYDSRIRIKGTNKVDRTKSPIPTTLLNNSITDYCSRPQKIMFILQKSDGESTYNKLFYEIKRDLFQTEKEFFTDGLKSLISIYINHAECIIFTVVHFLLSQKAIPIVLFVHSLGNDLIHRKP